jgi:hypothetical protein
MRKVPIASILLAMSAGTGCGDREHAAFIPIKTGARDGGATGGRRSGAGGTPGSGEIGTDGGDTGGEGGSGGRSGGPPLNVPSWGLTGGFDQSKVYLLGEIEQTPKCNHYAVSLVSEPNQYAPAFPCLLPNRFTISDGKLYYENGNGLEIHEFVPDYSDEYPTNSIANDPKIDAPCPLIQGYLFNPSGILLYKCIGTGWFEAGGVSVYEGNDTIVAFTDGGLVATPAGVMSLDEKVLHKVPALANALSVRVHGEEFHYVVQPASAPAELWSVDAAGKTTKLGGYPAAPAGVKPVSDTQPLLAHDDSLYAAGSEAANNGFEVIYRRTIDGESEVVYTEADAPIVKMNAGSPMITGP